jgi:hypothetical protein
LFDEVQARTREVSEALERQTATSEVLATISGSPGELQPVFDAMLANATRLCDAKFGTLSLYDGDQFRNVALHNVPPAFTDIRLRQSFRPHPKSGLAHVARTNQITHTEDLRAQPPYLEGDPAVVAIADVAGARTIINVPMLKDQTLVGAISIFRQEVRSFTDKQIELMRTPARPSSRSRTRGCSTSCANPYSNRPPPPTCSRSSTARPSICRPCWIHFPDQPPVVAPACGCSPRRRALSRREPGHSKEIHERVKQHLLTRSNRPAADRWSGAR